jgi:hypothetical protein
MPLKKNLIKISHSKALIIPHDYLAYYELLKGKTINKVNIEINKKLIISPIFDDINQSNNCKESNRLSNNIKLISDIKNHLNKEGK